MSSTAIKERKIEIDEVVKILNTIYFRDLNHQIYPINITLNKHPMAYPISKIINPCSVFTDYSLIASVPDSLEEHPRKKEILLGLLGREFTRVYLGYSRHNESNNPTLSQKNKNRLAKWLELQELKKIEKNTDDELIRRGLGLERYILQRYIDFCLDGQTEDNNLSYSSRDILKKTIKHKKKIYIP